MNIKNIVTITTGILILSSCVVSKKKYSVLETKNQQLEKELAEVKSVPVIDMNNEISKISYSLGVNLGINIKAQGMKSIDTAAFAQAVGDVFGERNGLTTPQKAQQDLQAYFGQLQTELIEKQSAEGAKFLSLNSMKEGVVSLPSGLQYKILKQGTGAIPKSTDQVKTHYSGTLIDGTKFDSSYDRGQPATFGVTQVIKGWVEALQIMPEGSKWELYIPHQLAYGSQGQGSIPPYSALIFQIELIEIVTQ
jgi:FKBP-type peptidyl-prolyl cis-trans isomerase FklB